MEAADNCDSGISKGSGQVISFEYDIAGAFDRTEETKQISVQNIKVSDIPNVWIVFLNIHFLKCTGAFGTIGFNFFSGVRHGFKVYPGGRFMSGFVLILRVIKWLKRGISVYLQNVNDAFHFGIGRAGMSGSCPVCPLIPGACTSADAGKQRQIFHSGRSLSATCCDIGLYQFRHLGINPAIQ